MKAAKKAPALYVGETVKVKRDGKIASGAVLELGDDEFCIEFGDGVTRWIKNSAVIR